MIRASRPFTAAPLLGAVALAASLLVGSVAHAQSDPVVLSFATVGDSRQDPAKADPSSPLTPQDAIWLQSTKPFSRILRSIQAQKPQMLFFNGDMVMGYGNADQPTDLTLPGILSSDMMKFYKQYAFWRGMVAGLMETGTYVVPVPGNHEVQCSDGVSKTCPKKGKNALVANENAWRDNMGDLVIDAARFQSVVGQPAANFNVSNVPGAADNITTDQRQLSYSFDVGNSHFSIINTDPVGYDSHAPVNWLASDLAAAKNRGAQHFFIFGHKLAMTYAYAGASGASGFDVDPVNQSAFVSLLDQYGATYFCGHEHTFNMSHPVKLSDKSVSSAWQVLVGSGGSPFDPKQGTPGLIPTDRYYAWANVRVFQSGKVQIDGYGFDGNTPNYGPTQLLKSVTLAH
jgi:hypothetical protein